MPDKIAQRNIELLNIVLREVILSHDPSYVEIIEIADNTAVKQTQINYKTNQGFIRGFFINQFELSNYCKLWAHKMGYVIWTDVGDCKFGLATSPLHLLKNLYGNVYNSCNNPISELDSVLKASVEILNEVKAKNGKSI